MTFSRNAAVCVLAAGLSCLQLAPATAQTIVPTQADRDAYETGRASARTVLVFGDPRICAIVLERSRCSRDLELFLARYPRFPAADAAKLRAAFATGDFSKLDQRYQQVNSAFVSEPERLKDPHGAWLMQAGIASVEVPAAMDQLARVMAAPNAIELAREAGAAGSFRAIVPESVISRVVEATPDPKGVVPLGLAPDEVGAYETSLVSALNATFPPRPFPQIAYVAGLRGNAQLGVAFATLIELAEVPRVLVQPDAQLFVDATFARLIEAQPAAASRLQALRADFAAGPQILELYRSGGPVQRLIELQKQLDPATLRALLLGQLSAQLAFNAVVYRDPKFSNEFRSKVETLDEVDAVLPGLARLRAALKGPGSKDWPAINADASAIVQRLVAP